MWKFAALAVIAVAGFFTFSSGGSSVASREAGGEGAGLSGIYPSDINISDDPAGHHPFVGMPESLDLNVAIDGLEISITGAAPWVGVSGTIKGGEFFASGAGTVAGNENIAVDFQGTLTSDALAGLYTMGANEGLPGGLSIIYEIKPPKLYAITVLKRNDDTKQGLPGWEINLYAGGTCSGNAIDSGTTDADGLLEFSGLIPGAYSVEEKLQPNWNAVSDVCQAATVPGPAGSGAGTLPTCPVSPNLPFPDPGCDEFSSVATVQVVFTNPPIDPLECDLSGPTQITRGAVVSKPPDSIDTEIVAMELTGQCEPGAIAVTVRESPTQASTGRIVEQADGIVGTLEFKADSFFDVFFEIDTPLGTLHNQDALRINCKIQGIPPFGCLYEPDVGVIPLFDDTEKEVGTLLHAAHIPIDPNKVLVIFSNAPKKISTPLTFYQLNGSAWNSDIIKTMLEHANAVWAPANINFTWPNQPTLHPATDPDTTRGDKGDVFDDAETDDVCERVRGLRDTNKPGTFPVILVGELSGVPGEDWGVTTIKDGPVETGLCLLLSDEIKNEPHPKLGETLAHEMGHVFCLDHTDIDSPEMKTDPDDTNNLMHPTAKPTGNKLTKQQMRAARECAKELLQQLQEAPTPTPTGPTPTPTATPTTQIGDVNCDGVTNSIDAALVLQLDAALIASLDCEDAADVNGDGATNRVDAAIILQYAAGLIDSLPV